MQIEIHDIKGVAIDYFLNLIVEKHPIDMNGINSLSEFVSVVFTGDSSKLSHWFLDDLYTGEIELSEDIKRFYEEYNLHGERFVGLIKEQCISPNIPDFDTSKLADLSSKVTDDICDFFSESDPVELSLKLTDVIADYESQLSQLTLLKAVLDNKTA